MSFNTICLYCKVYFFSQDEGATILISDDETPFRLYACKNCAYNLKNKITEQLQNEQGK